MPPKKRKRNALVLECEWGSCDEVYNDMDAFCKHIGEHLNALNSTEDDTGEADGVHKCLWRECGLCSSDGLEELRRHVFFHCFHTKLKQRGKQVLDAQPEPSTCTIGSGRNLIPDIPDNFVCLWEECEHQPFENPDWFYRHVEMHTLCVDIPAGDCEFPIRCGWKDCEATAKGRHKLREHLRSHTQEKITACPGCGGMYASNTKLFDHIIRQSATEGQGRFQCSHCSKRFATERLLRDHMRNHVSHYKCPLCDMTCPTPSSLRNHIKFRHSTEKPYSCKYCEYSCKNQMDLRKHLDTHRIEPAFRCDVPGCGFTARTLCTMKCHHKKDHQGDFIARYKCHVCDACFTRGNNLTVHLHKKHQFKWPSGHPRFRYKEHDDGFMRLQLIRYESVELTEQLMREKDRQEEDSGQGGVRALEQGSVPAELELRGVLLEEQSPEKQSVPDQLMMYVLSGDVTPVAGSAVLLQLQDSNQEQGIQVNCHD